MTPSKKLSLVAAFCFSVAAGALLTGANGKILCEGILPPNDMKIPVNSVMSGDGGINQADFDDVLDQVEAYYESVVAARGGNLIVRRLWDDPTVNASAMQMGSSYYINMYGGLARHKEITKDGFMLVACHEMGHHVAGAPKNSGWTGSWASNEGQADYYSTLRCLRYLLNDSDNHKWADENTIDPIAMDRCQRLYNTTEEELLCGRLAMAGMSVALLFNDLRQDGEPAFDTPDQNVVDRTQNGHPATQCRLDTYFEGAACIHNIDESLSDSDPKKGTCNRSEGMADGVRPLCWFAPRS